MSEENKNLIKDSETEDFEQSKKQVQEVQNHQKLDDMEKDRVPNLFRRAFREIVKLFYGG